MPLYAFTVYVADALFNMNVHGNWAGNLNMTLGNFGNGFPISHSNQGLFPSEVNLTLGLYATPADMSLDFNSGAAALSAAPPTASAVFRQ